MPQITIAGDVNLLGWEGKRISIWEKYDANGKEYSRLWTAWFDISQADRIQEQDWVTITGELSTKIGAYTPKGSTEEKTVVEHHIQNAQLTAVVSKDQQTANINAEAPGSFENAPF
jgi:hypothetical protein